MKRLPFEPASASDPLGVVAGEAAQELGSALTAIQVAVERLERRWDAAGSTGDPGGLANGAEGTAPRELAVIRGQTERLAGLARRLLLVSRPQESHPEEMDLGGELLRFLAPVRRGLREEGIEFEVRGPPAACPVVVRVDPALTRDVLLAVLANARHAVLAAPPPRWIRAELRLPAPGFPPVHGDGARSAPPLVQGGGDHPASGPAQTSGADQRLPPPGFVDLLVQDSGPGVPSGQEERIFLPFVSGWGGEGLGLSRGRAALARQGGDLLLLPHPRFGSEFVLRLPALGSSPSHRPSE